MIRAVAAEHAVLRRRSHLVTQSDFSISSSMEDVRNRISIAFVYYLPNYLFLSGQYLTLHVGSPVMLLSFSQKEVV
jgi:hypothetical protein